MADSDSGDAFHAHAVIDDDAHRRHLFLRLRLRGAVAADPLHDQLHLIAAGDKDEPRQRVIEPRRRVARLRALHDAKVGILVDHGQGDRAGKPEEQDLAPSHGVHVVRLWLRTEEKRHRGEHALQGEGSEKQKEHQVRDVLHGPPLFKEVVTQNSRSFQCADFACFTSSVSAGTIWKRSPTTPRSATRKIGASGSLLIATMCFDDDIPARCWIAPEMPAAIERSGLTTRPVCPTWCW